MKKFKLFALTALLAQGTNAFAEHNLTSGSSQTIGNIEYTVVKVYNTPTAAKVNTVKAKANSFTAEALVIPETVSFFVQGTDDESTSVTISKEVTFNVVAIEENGFINNTNIKSVSIPANVETIGAFAFEGCENLTSVTLAANSKLIEIGDGAFAYTSLTKLDLTNATANTKGNTDTTDDGMREFGWSTASGGTDVQTGSPFVSTKTSHTTNLMIKEVVLPSVCATINAKAFKNSKNLATIDLTKVSEIKANAFENCTKLTSVQIGTGITFAAAAATNGVKVAADAFTGCANLATVELGTLIVAADIDDNAFDKTHGSCTKLATFTFNEIRGAISATAFNLATVRTLNFKNYIKTESLIPDAAFQAAFPDTDEENTINYIYTDRGTNTLVQGIATKAFSTSTATKIITMNTTSEFEGEGYTINKVNIVGGYSSDILIANATTKKLVKDKNSDYYYYFVTLAAGEKKAILKDQESGAKVTVYQAYMDVVDDVATAYFMPVRVKDGKYVIGNRTDNGTTKQTYIVKSNQEDGVVASVEATANYTTVFDASAAPINDLQNSENNTYSLLKVQTDDDLMNGGAKDVWFFNNPATSGFGFTKFDVDSQTGGIGKNTVYMVCAATAAARLNIVWLDENGETTAVQTINAKAPVAEGAIYNLAGQKVDANYKGIVIKNGKKMIQK